MLPDHLCGQSNHHFEPRYDLTTNKSGQDLVAVIVSELPYPISGLDIRKIIEVAKDKKYIHDVCIYCGKTVNNSANQT